MATLLTAGVFAAPAFPALAAPAPVRYAAGLGEPLGWHTVNRLPGNPYVRPVQPILPGGWRVGPEISSPYALGLSLAYLFPAPPVTFKTGLDWGLWSDSGVSALQFRDMRLFGGLMYYFVPNATDGPYVETGLDVVRSQGGILRFANWPVVPHLGFGNVLRAGTTLVDVDLSATANGLVTLTGGMLFGGQSGSGAVADDGGN